MKKIKSRISLSVRACKVEAISPEEAIDSLLQFVKGKLHDYAWYGFIAGIFVAQIIEAIKDTIK